MPSGWPSSYDAVVDGSDNWTTRYAVSDACFRAKRTLVTGSVGTFDGSVTVLKPHETGPDGQPNPTYRCLFPAPPPDGSVPTCAEAGVLGALTGLVGSLMALEAIRTIVPFGEGLVGRLLLVDARSMRFETLRYGWDPENPLNGSGAPESRPALVRTGAQSHFRTPASSPVLDRLQRGAATATIFRAATRGGTRSRRRARLPIGAPPSLKPPMSRISSSASRASPWLAAVDSSTMAAFCWVTWSIWLMALLTWSRPEACSCAEAAISATAMAISVTWTAIPSSAVPVRPTRSTPRSTCPREVEIRPLISLAASAERCARARTSDATTAKPRPASPARAASTPGIERQEVRLEGDLVDDADDLGDLGRGLLDAAHRLDGVAHDAARFLGARLGLQHGGLGLAGAFGGLAHRGGDLVERRRGLLERGRLLLGAARQVVGRVRDLARAGPDGAAVLRHHRQRLLELAHGAVEIGAELLVFGREGPVEAGHEVALRQAVETVCDGGHDLGLLTGDLGARRFGAGPLLLGGAAGVSRLRPPAPGPGSRHP